MRKSLRASRGLWGRRERSRSSRNPSIASKTGGVERFKDVEGFEEEGAGAAGWVEYGDVDKGLPEGAHQFGPFAVGDYVQGELFDVEVAGDEVVDRRDLADRQLGVDLLVTAAAGDVLTPGLGGEGVFFRGGFVPAAAVGYVVEAGGDVVGGNSCFNLQPAFCCGYHR